MGTVWQGNPIWTGYNGAARWKGLENMGCIIWLQLQSDNFHYFYFELGL